MKKCIIKNHWPYLALVCWLVFYIYCVVVGNLVFIHQPYALTVDELSDLHLIRKIQGSFDSWQLFFKNFIFENPDPSHGFITYAFPAIISFFTKFFWGNDSVIFTHRLSSAFFFLGSLLILSLTFVRQHYLKILLFFLIMGIPYINVFVFWPRCESYLYFFTALFLFLQFHTSFRSIWAFFFLAIGLSARPAIIFYLPFFYIVPFFLSGIAREGRQAIFKYFLKVFVFSLLGLLLAQPHFILPSNIAQFVTNHFELLETETGVRNYINDQWWMENIIQFYFSPRFYLSTRSHLILWLGGFSTLLSLCFIFPQIRSQLKQVQARLIFFTGVNLISVFCFLFVIFNVQKGVGWYLQLYLILIFVSSFWLISFFTQNLIWSRFVFYPLLTIYSVCFFSQQFPFSPYFQMEYSLWQMMERPQSSYHKNLQKEYERSQILLSAISKALGRRLHVRIMAEQYQLSNTSEYEVHPLWYPAPFYKFDKNLDIIIFYKKLYAPNNPENLTETGELVMRRESVQNYLQLVVPAYGGKCQKDCFDALPITDELYLFYSTKIFKKREKLLPYIRSL